MSVLLANFLDVLSLDFSGSARGPSDPSLGFGPGLGPGADPSPWGPGPGPGPGSRSFPR